jgi:hypothetical protein
MILQTKKQIYANKPVKAFKVVCVVENKYFTGPFGLEQTQPDEWVTASVPRSRYLYLRNDVGYHAFKSLAMANRGLHYMARHGLLSWRGYPHYVVPVYLRGTVSFGTYYGKFKGVKGTEMLIKSKHLPEGRHGNRTRRI